MVFFSKVPPRQILRLAALGFMLTAVLFLALIAAGVMDPQPIGHLVWTQKPGAKSAVGQAPTLTWVTPALQASNFTVRSVITHQSGDVDSGAGIALGDNCTAVLVVLSPLGYVSIQPIVPARQGEGALACQTKPDPPTDPLLLWQPWPHVHQGQAPNDVWVDIKDGQMWVRVNRELLWTGQAPLQPEQIGLYVESFGDTAVYTFQELQLFAEID